MEHDMSLVAVKCLMMLRRKRVGEKRGTDCKILSGQFCPSVNCTALPVRCCWSPNPGLARMTTYIQHHCTKH